MGEPACCAFRNTHDETLQAMGEPEYWWTMDSLVEAAAEKEAQSPVAHASHVVQPPSHQESMQTRTMKRLEGGTRRLNKLSASSLRLRARAPEDGALAKSLLDTETTISRLVFDLSHSITASRTKTARSAGPAAGGSISG